MSLPEVSVVIPSYERGPVLLQTLEQLLALEHAPLEILVVDQTPRPEPAVSAALERLQAGEVVRWIRRQPPGITAAMNHGARLARAPVLLFLDDDVRITHELVRGHAEAHARSGAAIVAGQVIQPWEAPLAPEEGGYPSGRENEPDAFRFNASAPGPARRFAGGNVSIRRDALFALGGFDENFRGAAYRFEADLAERAFRRGLVMVFEPHASLEHLHAPHGGTRRHGSHLRTVSPRHSVGRYYYCLLHARVPGVLRATLEESMRALVARHHLSRPWWIPLCAVAELAGLVWAVGLCLGGPRHPLAGSGAP